MRAFLSESVAGGERLFITRRIDPLDFNLEAGIAKGDPDAYGRLFDLYAGELLRCGYAMLAQAQDAEDVMQESLLAFLDAVRKGRFQGDNGAARAYLRSAMRNRCIDRLRKRGALSIPIEEVEESIGLPDRDSPTASQKIDDERIQMRFQEAILKLPDAQRVAITLLVSDEMPYAQIADEMGVSVNYVKNLLARARKRLREALRPLLEERSHP